MSDGGLYGRRVLVVEDELLLVLLMEDFLAFYGCEIVGPASRLDEALTMVQNNNFDCALVDVNLRGEFGYPVADALVERGVPFVFTTAYERDALPEAYRHFPLLQKPFEQLELRDILMAALAASGAQG